MPGRLDRKDLAKYPFLKEAQEWVAGRTGSLPDFFSSNYGRIAARHAVERIRDAMEGGRPAAPGPERLDPDREVYAYAIARVLVSCTRDRLLMDRLSRYEAERASRYLADEAPATRALVAEGVGMPTEAGDLPVARYVELASHLKDDRWRLVNREVEKGRVTLGDGDLPDLMEERIRILLLSQLPLPVPPAICELLSPLSAELTAAHQQYLLREFGSVEEGAFPPCIRTLTAAITSGANLSHSGRFALTAFLHNIGMNPIQIMELFARAPDFDAGKTQYQVEHISGRSGTEYTAPSCATMRTHGICTGKDSLCTRVSHPLSYYRAQKQWKKQGQDSADRAPDQPAGPGHGGDEYKEGQQVGHPRVTGKSHREDQEKHDKNNKTHRTGEDIQ